jgi:SAM-dependent methyltransferase
VIPGEVEPDLWNEHVSRYHFAALFAAGKSVLDAGCGTGYGTALLAAQAAEAAGFDASPEAVAYAREKYPCARFTAGSANAFPASDNSVDLVTAFDLIEHIPDWQSLVEEADRVLKPDGVFLLSAPHRLYYSEAAPSPSPAQLERGALEEALARVFPFVRMVAQNHQECVLFAGEQESGAGLSSLGEAPDLREAHFFVAVCARQPVEIPLFAYMPTSGNLLRERDHYIRSLNSELYQARVEHARLLETHRRLEEEVNRQSAWAVSLDRDLDSARTDILVTRAERSAARAEVERLQQERRLAANSRWLRLGRRFNVGPDLDRAS